LVAFGVTLTQASGQTDRGLRTPAYANLAEPSEYGLGFLSDGKSLYAGGCRVFDLMSQTFGDKCRFPRNTRWGHVSPDGSMMLATTVDPHTKIARSLQINTADGRVLTSRPGIHFATPVAIHPNNKFWAVARAGSGAQGPETVDVIRHTWVPKIKGVYADTDRIFDLSFSAAGDVLSVNGGGSLDGGLISTTTWKLLPRQKHSGLVALRANSDGTFEARIDGQRVVVVEITTQREIVSLALDVSNEEPQVAFSSDGKWFAAKGYRQAGGERTYAVGVVNLPERK
jgi:hypothetical protein